MNNLSAWKFSIFLFVIIWLVFVVYIRKYNETLHVLKHYKCKIPKLTPVNKDIESYIDKKRDLRCSIVIPEIIQDNATHFYFANNPYINPKYLNCSYKYFHRFRNGSKVFYNFKKKRGDLFSAPVKATGEFVKVECMNNGSKVYEKYMAFVTYPNKSRSKDSHSEKLQPNIIFVGIDSNSRMNLYRTLPKTVAYLKANLSAIDFEAFNKIGVNTYPNLYAMLSGMKNDDVKKKCNYNFDSWDNCKNNFIWETLRNSSYMTAFAEDATWIGLFGVSPFYKTPTDYWWPTFDYVVENKIGEKNIVNFFTSFNHCVGDKLLHLEVLNYCRKFMEIMETNQQPFHGFFWISSLNHDRSYILYDADEHFVSFLSQISHRLNNTFLFFVSDHGHRYSYLRQTYQGALEERLPYLFIHVPEWFKQKYKLAYKNLFNNRQKLITPYDVYDTQRDILNLENLEDEKLILREKSSYSLPTTMSLFDDIPASRNCETAGIDARWCACAPIESVDIKNEVIEYGAKFIVDKIINPMLLKALPKCAKLSLKKIVNAYSVSVSDHTDADLHFIEYRIIFETSPGTGIFEATVMYSTYHDDYSMLNHDISRINSYGTESECVDDVKLKLFCYC